MATENADPHPERAGPVIEPQEVAVRIRRPGGSRDVTGLDAAVESLSRNQNGMPASVPQRRTFFRRALLEDELPGTPNAVFVLGC